MLLAVDVGNSNIVTGVFEKETLVTSFRINTDRNKTSDEYAVQLITLIEKNDISPEDLSGAIIASVVPGVLEILTQTISVYLDIEPIVVDANIKTDLKIECDNPDEIGADRIANAVAALKKYESDCIVVDLGTATTMDFVSGDWEFLGGIIAPGFITSADALFNRAPRLPRVDYVRPSNVIGKNTVESLRSGIVLGYASMIDGMIERIMLEIESETIVVATGGLSHLVSRESKYIDHIDDHLTIKGLREIFELNV